MLKRMAFVPAVLLGEAKQKANDQSSKNQDQPTDSAVDSDQGHTVAQETRETSVDAFVLPDRKNEKKKVEDERDKGKEKEKDSEIEKEKLRGHEGTNLDGLLQRLPGCVSRDLIDQLTVEFCYLNSKS